MFPLQSITFQLNLRVSWVDSRLVYPEDLSSPQSTSSHTTPPSDTTHTTPPSDTTHTTLTDAPVTPVKKIAVSTDVLKQIWVPDPFFRRTRDLKLFRLLQDVQGVFLYSDNKVYTSMV